MNLLFVKSNKLGSKLIQWAVEQSVSHVVVEFDDVTHELFHSYGSGVQSLSVEGFREHGYEIIHRLPLPMTAAQERDAHITFKNSIGYQAYDYPAFLYFAYRVLLKKLFGVPYPEINKWSIIDQNLCTEVIYLAVETYSRHTGRAAIPDDIDLAMITPEDAYFAISKFIREPV